MSPFTVVILAIYAAAIFILVKKWRNVWESMRGFSDDMEWSWGSAVIGLLLSPLIIGFIAIVLILPIAFTEGWMGDSRPDGCYRQVTTQQYNPATKTFMPQTKYHPVPCPEQVVNR